MIHTMELHLTAESVEQGRLCLLSVGPRPQPEKNLGLSETDITKHMYEDLKHLCAFIKANCTPGEVDLAKLRSDLSQGKSFQVPISTASAVKMGFKP